MALKAIGTGAFALGLAAAAPSSAAWAQAAGSGATPQTQPTDAATPSAPQAFAVHAQTTFVYQGQDSFDSPFRGPNSLGPKANARETWDLTLYIGARLWKGAEVWVNPEVDQGFGLSDTLGVAGFVSGEAYKVGSAEPYLRLQRIFIRQTIDLAGKTEAVDADLNQLAGSRSVNRIVVTAGKVSVGDIFDTNGLAHDPRGDFLNWSLIDAGTFDYAADSWGYTAGAAVEWYQGRWTLRGGAFLTSNVPNSENIDTRFKQFQLEGEIEERHALWGRAGKLKLTGFLTRAREGRFDDAVALAASTGGTPDTAAVRRYAGRGGVSVNLEQALSDDLGAFARLGFADGSRESFDFTDIDRTVSGGLSLAGKRWGRASDTIGLAGVLNEASTARQRYLAAGGLGILIGDGRLPHPDSERILEGYYDVGLAKGLHVALDYQHVVNPGYDPDRGPVDVLALRLHGQF